MVFCVGACVVPGLGFVDSSELAIGLDILNLRPLRLKNSSESSETNEQDLYQISKVTISIITSENDVWNYRILDKLELDNV